MYNYTDETTAVNALAQDYFKAMITGDEAELRRVFHPQAPIVGYLGDEFNFDSLDAFIDIVTNAPAANENGKPFEYAVNGLVLTDNTAVVTVSNTCFNAQFVDHLSMVKVDGQWCIVAKTYGTKC